MKVHLYIKVEYFPASIQKHQLTLIKQTNQKKKVKVTHEQIKLMFNQNTLIESDSCIYIGLIDLNVHNPLHQGILDTSKNRSFILDRGTSLQYIKILDVIKKHSELYNHYEKSVNSLLAKSVITVTPEKLNKMIAIYPKLLRNKPQTLSYSDFMTYYSQAT